MAKTQTIKFNEFMSGEYKAPKKKAKKAVSFKTVTKVGLGVGIPLALGSPAGAVLGASRAFASESIPVTATPEAIPVGVAEWGGEKALQALAHVLDPIVDVLVALSFPVASVIIVGGCFFFMFGNSEKAWTTIQNASLGYVLIQVSPLILNVLKQVGSAV